LRFDKILMIKLRNCRFAAEYTGKKILKKQFLMQLYQKPEGVLLIGPLIRRNADSVLTDIVVCVKQKETTSKSSSVPQSSGWKDKEPASWRWDKQELERQVKDWKKKYEDLVQSSADAKKDKDKVALKPAAKFGAATSAVTYDTTRLYYIQLYSPC